jgi:mono/diheme cytochrome c family protein
VAQLKSSLIALSLLPLVIFSCGDDAQVANPGPTQEQLVARGDYLVNHVSACLDCHTPRNMDGSLDMSRFMAGAECFIDVDPETDGVGCLNTPNLTNDPTGLQEHTDQEIKDMFLSGMDEDEVLHPVMPYWVFGNMTADDADAIVAYLRTIEGVDHELPENEPPWDMRPEAPANRLDLALIPAPAQDHPDFEAAMHGRYLAAQAGVCIECHTLENPPGSADPIQLDMAFAGGREFPIAPGFGVYSANITPDATGIEELTVEDIVKVLHEGVDEEGKPLCPPMPVGPMGAFGGLTDEDANDIAIYLLSLPPLENEVEECVPPMPGAGGAAGAEGGGAGAGGA